MDANIPDNPPSKNGNLIARPVTIMHQDGTTETAYLMQMPADKKNIKDHVQDHATMWYLLFGTLALALSAIISYKKLKSS